MACKYKMKKFMQYGECGPLLQLVLPLEQKCSVAIMW